MNALSIRSSLLALLLVSFLALGVAYTEVVPVQEDHRHETPAFDHFIGPRNRHLWWSKALVVNEEGLALTRRAAGEQEWMAKHLNEIREEELKTLNNYLRSLGDSQFHKSGYKIEEARTTVDYQRMVFLHRALAYHSFDSGLSASEVIKALREFEDGIKWDAGVLGPEDPVVHIAFERGANPGQKMKAIEGMQEELKELMLGSLRGSLGNRRGGKEQVVKTARGVGSAHVKGVLAAVKGEHHTGIAEEDAVKVLDGFLKGWRFEGPGETTILGSAMSSW